MKNVNRQINRFLDLAKLTTSLLGEHSALEPAALLWLCLQLNNLTWCRGTFSFKGSNMLFFSFVCRFSRIYYSLSVPGKQEWAELHEFSGLRPWEGAPAWIPFSDSLQWLPSVTLLKCNLFSYAPLPQDIECFLALWRLLFAWLCFCSIFFTA